MLCWDVLGVSENGKRQRKRDREQQNDRRKALIDGTGNGSGQIKSQLRLSGAMAWCIARRSGQCLPYRPRLYIVQGAFRFRCSCTKLCSGSNSDLHISVCITFAAFRASSRGSSFVLNASLHPLRSAACSNMCQLVPAANRSVTKDTPPSPPMQRCRAGMMDIRKKGKR